MTDIFDDTICSLGEGPLWHPERQELFWFDINAHRLYAKGPGDAPDQRRVWQFDDYVSAGAWVDRTRLLVAKATALVLFDLESGTEEALCPLEADNPATRSNDGRADPQGGFWIGTMSVTAVPDAGAIYRYYRGEIRQLYAPIHVPNAISFTPDGRHAYFTDTPKGRIWRQALDAQGWPKGAPELFVELPSKTHRPDGAVVDTEGRLWCAHYGKGKLTCHTPDGREVLSIPVPASRPTCPAFGAPGTLYLTSARQQMDAPGPEDGLTYRLQVEAEGQAEHRVIL
ncbi:MAG: SMP-30/gluconolactonase/LRE family protein [Allgaiera sp.]|jgi:sugar lactone lactonase YvrE|nr:SMP-30/gluconolactonase/LRE family protein [Allgaiera sp.]